MYPNCIQAKKITAKIAVTIACKLLIYKGKLSGDPYEIRTRIAAVKGRLKAVSTSHIWRNQAI